MSGLGPFEGRQPNQVSVGPCEELQGGGGREREGEGGVRRDLVMVRCQPRLMSSPL